MPENKADNQSGETVFILKLMRILKLTAGIGCIVLALFFLLGVVSSLLSDFADDAVLCAIPAFLFGMVGWILISKRKGPVSMKSRATLGGFMLLLGYFIFAVVIPGLVAARYVSNQNACVNNLRQLEAAENEWTLENGKTNGTPVTANDITPYIQLDSKGQLPKCPQGGTYILGRVGEDVRCSLGTSDWPYRHVLDDTNGFTYWENIKGAYATLFGLHDPRKP